MLRLSGGVDGRADRGRPACLVTLNSQDLGGALATFAATSDPDRGRRRSAATRGRGGAALFSSWVVGMSAGSRRSRATLMVRICDTLTGHRGGRRGFSRVTLPPAPCWLGMGVQVMVDELHPAPVLDAASLRCRSSTPTPAAEPLRRYADDVPARRAGRDDLVARAERWVLENRIPADVGVTRFARSLGMSDRTWRGGCRRRPDAGRAGRRPAPAARRPISGGARLPLGRITYLLGYSDLSAFTRAFRRWTGRTPSEWRAELLRPRSPRHHRPRRRKDAPCLSGIRADRQTAVVSLVPLSSSASRRYDGRKCQMVGGGR